MLRFLVSRSLKVLSTKVNIHLFTQIPTLMAGAAMQDAKQPNRSNLVLTVLPRDTLTFGLDELGFEPLILQLVATHSTSSDLLQF